MSARRVPVNAAALLVSRVVSALATVAVVSIAAHELDLDEFGLVTSTLAAGFLANMAVTFGTDTVITRAVAAERSDAAATVATSLRLQLGAAALLVLIAWLAVASGAPAVIGIQATALLPQAVGTVTSAVLRGSQRMDWLLIASVGGSVASLIAVVVGFSFTADPWVPVLAFAIGSAATAAIGWLLAAKLSVAAGDGRGIVDLVRETAPFAAMVVAAAVGAQGALLLVEFGTDETTGGYGAAVRLTEAARLIPAAAMGAFFPAMMSGLHRTDRYRRWVRWLYVYVVAATVVLLMAAGWINDTVFDAQPDGATLIRILSLGLVVTVTRLAFSFEAIAVGHERTVLASAVTGMLVVLIGGAVVAGRFGAEGIAWAHLAGLVTATLWLILDPRRRRATAPPAF